MSKWVYFAAGVLVGAILTAAGGSYWLYLAAGSIPLIGKTIQYKVRIKAGLEKPKDFSQGHGDRRRGRHK